MTAAYPDTTPPVPARFTALLVLLPTVAVAAAIRGWRRRAGDSAERLRRAQAEHEAETRRAVEAERARIASELHDVVTHNVSVMVVQAGAARRVLDSSPDEAREALLAVEASGRTAMPSCGTCSGCWLRQASEEDTLVPQPGVARLPALVERVRAAGLSVELPVTRGPAARRGPGRLPGSAGGAHQCDQARRNQPAPPSSSSTARRTCSSRSPTRPPGDGAGRTGGWGGSGLREWIGLYGGGMTLGAAPGRRLAGPGEDPAGGSANFRPAGGVG